MPDMVPEESEFTPPEGVAFDPNSEGPQSFYAPGMYANVCKYILGLQ